MPTTNDVLRKLDELAAQLGDNPQARQALDEIREDVIALGGNGASGEQAATPV